MIRAIPTALVVLGCLAPLVRADDTDLTFEGVRRRFQDAPRIIESDLAGALVQAARGSHPEAVDLIMGEIKSRPTPGIWAHGIVALERMEGSAVLQRLLAFARDGDLHQRTAAVLAVRQSRENGARSILARALLDPEPAVRTAAVHSVSGPARGPAGLIALKEALTDDAWTVRAAAVAGLGQRTKEEAVPSLISVLSKEKRGRIVEDALAHLRNLTSQDFGLDADLWASWWETRVDPPKGEIVYGTPRYYGLPVVGDRAVFILDVSGSMEAQALLTSDQRHRLEIPSEDCSKLELARIQLARALSELPRERKFGVVPYSDIPAPWHMTLDPATPERTRAATASVRKLPAEGGTNIYDSLLSGALLGVRGKFLENLDEGPDQLLFLTDGIPSVGTYVNTQAIERVMELLCAVRRIRVDCVGIGRSDVKFLQILSRENGGQYISVGR